MTRSIWTRRAVLPTALMMVSGVMLGLTPTPASAGDTPPPVTAVSIDDDRMITMNTTLTPGLNAFDITSTKNSAFQLAIRGPGYTKRELAKDVNDGFGKNDLKAIKRFEKNTTLLGGVSSSPDEMGMMTATLPADASGTLMAIDTNARFKPSKILDLTIAGDEVPATADYDATIRAKDATKWARKPASIPREGTVRFLNGATENHFMAMVKLRKGKTFEDWRAWVRKVKRGERAKPPVKFSVGLDSGVVSPSQEMTFDYSLPKGNYVLACFWPDASMGGMPHAFMGMSRPIKLVAGG